MTRMTEDKLKALTSSELNQCFGGISGGRLSEERRRAMYYYQGVAKDDLAPPDIDGRSTFVDTTVRNQIEWMVPQLMKTFCSSDNVVEFTPSKEGDDEKAQQATEYINYLFFKKNDGYIQLQTAIRDALLQKAGILKVWWDDREEETREEYKGMSDIDLAQMADDDEIVPIEQKSYVDEYDVQERNKALEKLTAQLQQAQAILQAEPQAMGQPSPQSQQAMQGVQALTQQIEQLQATPPKMLYDVTYKRTKKAGKLCIEAVPPEEFLISRKSKKISDGFMKGHRVRRTISDLKAMGYKNVDDISSDDQENVFNGEAVERDSWDDENAYYDSTDANLDESMRLVWLTELYMQVDYDGDGIAEWRKIVRAGNQILENVECDGAPFAALIPIVLPHRFFGLSVADLGIEPQRLQTQLVRSILDNQFLQVNGRYFAVDGQVNLDDLLTSRPGGVVRVKSKGAVGRLDQSMGDTAGAMQMLEWMQDFSENSTGWTRRSQGTGASALQQQTATGMNLISNRDDMRLDLIARNFAEGGITDLFRLMLKLVCQYQNREEMINVSGSFLQINPREWKNQFILTVNVGLGTNNKEQQAQHLMGLMQIQREALQIGVATPDNVYNAAKLYAEALGQKTGDKFFTDPKKNPPPEPQPPPELLKIQSAEKIEQMKLQADAQKYQAGEMANDKKVQLEYQKDMQVIQLQAEKEAHQAQMDMQERQHQAELTAALESRKLEFEQWKTEYETNAKIAIAELQSRTSLKQSSLTANANKEAETLTEINEDGDEAPTSALSGLVEAINTNMMQLVNTQNERHAELVSVMTRPKQIIRDAQGKAQGVM
ncbi:MAG: hypothetical protein V4605_00825 [Pseudomonadota bacterium]